MTKPRLTALNASIAGKLESLKAGLAKLCECLMCCCKKDKDVEAQSESEKQTSKIQQDTEDDSAEPQKQAFKFQPDVEDNSLTASNDQELNQPSNDMSKDSAGDVEDQLIKTESGRDKTAKENALSFVLNIRAVFDELLIDTNGKF